MDMVKLKEALVIARRTGEDAAATCAGDGGSANSDKVMLPTGRTHQIKRKSSKVEAAIEGAGLSCWFSGSGWRRGYLIVPPGGGMGARRMAAMEAMCASLVAQGIEASCWYQVD